MRSQIVALRVGGTVFGVMCLAQVARLTIFPDLDVMIEAHRMPLWPSALASVLLGAMSAWLWKVSFEKPR
jgi:hypothetical protein